MTSTPAGPANAPNPAAVARRAVISTDRLTKTFSHAGVQQHVLRNLDLTIYAGDFTVIMGPSGAGKSTLLYALSGMDLSLIHICFDLCRRLRADPTTQALPILFLSARRSDDDEILALSLGGDDYLRKPFSLSVLLAKVRRILTRLEREGAGEGPVPYDDGHLRWDPNADRFWVDGSELTLPAMEHRLLRYCLEHRGKVLTKRELFAGVWGDAITGEGTLTVHVRRLRTRIEPDPVSYTHLDVYKRQAHTLVSGGARSAGQQHQHLGVVGVREHVEQARPDWAQGGHAA